MVQIDHTLVDIIIVDPVERLPIGRSYVTFAINVYSRCIAGFVLSLEAPSAVSIGLCLTHIAMDKAPWLAMLDINSSWPIFGKPNIIHVDNGTDFHSNALSRSCLQHGIKIEYRPIGKPHYGDIIERVIGTMMKLVHTLPGSTFSNIKEKGKEQVNENNLFRAIVGGLTKPYVKVKGKWKYLYRAINKYGKTEHFRVKYLNNIIESDHGRVKRRLRPMLGFKSFTSAYRCIKGVETMIMFAKNQSFWITNNLKNQIIFINKLFNLHLLDFAI